jgi:hypothetical protein
MDLINAGNVDPSSRRDEEQNNNSCREHRLIFDGLYGIYEETKSDYHDQEWRKCPIKTHSVGSKKR